MRAHIDDYLKKHVLVEIIYFFKRGDQHFENNLKDFSNKMISSFRHSDLLWNQFK